MSSLVLYTNPQSRGRIAHWMLEEVGEPYETVWVEYADMKEPGYLAVNPMGKVPALREGDVVVTETAAICAWLADRFPERGLAPTGAARAAWYRWLFFAAGPLEQALTAKGFGWEVAPGRASAAGFGSYEATLATVEAALEPGPWLCGDVFTAADVYLGSQLGWGMLFGTVEPRPVFKAYVERLQARPAAIRSNELNNARIAATSAGAAADPATDPAADPTPDPVTGTATGARA